MARKRKKKQEEEHINESWLLPYSDLMTLLLALFIVLFATSSINEAKLQQFSMAFGEIFNGGNGVFQELGPSPMPVPNPGESKDKKDTPENAAYLEDQKSLSEIQANVENYIAVNELEKQLVTKLTDEGLLVTIRDSVLFDPGSAEVKEEYLPIARDISELLAFDPPRHIVVTGHTDDVPMNTAQFRSNWELSVMRAVNFMKIIIENENLDPLLFSAKGYGEFQPIVPNDSVEGRNQNRRVEVLIQPLVLKDGTAVESTP